MANDMELGPAGAPKDATSKAVQTISPGSPPAPTGPAGGAPTNPLMDVAKAIVPGINTIMKGIETLEGAWKLLNPPSPTMSMGPSGPLPAGITKVNQLRLERAMRYTVAKKFIDEVMRIGKLADIDFTTWKAGSPPPPVDAAGMMSALTDFFKQHLGFDPAATGGGAGAGAGGGAGNGAAPAPAPTPAPAAPAAPAPQGFGKAQALVDFVNGASLADLKDRATTEILTKVQRADLHMPQWYWNGSNQQDFGEPPEKGNFTKMDFPLEYDRDADGRTYALVTWHMSVAKIPETERIGMPKEASHFSAISNENEAATDLGWYESGYYQVYITEAHGDSLKVTVPSARLSEGFNAPVGGHHLDFEFLWDNSHTEMHADLTFSPRSMLENLPQIDAKGTPKT